MPFHVFRLSNFPFQDLRGCCLNRKSFVASSIDSADSIVVDCIDFVDRTCQGDYIDCK